MGFLNGPISWLSGENKGVAPVADMRSARGDAMLQLGATLLAAAQRGPVGSRAQILAQGLPRVASNYRDTLTGAKKDRREDTMWNQSQEQFTESATSKARFKNLLMKNPSALGMDEGTAKMFRELPIGDAIDAYKTYLADKNKAEFAGKDGFKWDFAPSPDASGRLVGVKGNKSYYLDPTTMQPTGEVPVNPNAAGAVAVPAPNVPTKSTVAGDTKTEENQANELNTKRVNTEGAFETMGVMARALNETANMNDSDFGAIQGAEPDSITGGLYRGLNKFNPLAETNFGKQDSLRSLMKDAAATLTKQKMNNQGSISDSERKAIDYIVGGTTAYDKKTFEDIARSQMVSAAQVIVNNINSGFYTPEEASKKAALSGISLEQVYQLASQGQSVDPNAAVTGAAPSAPAPKEGVSSGVLKPKGDGTFIWSPK